MLSVCTCWAQQGAATVTEAGPGSTAGAVILKEGTIIYERKVDLYRRMTDESMKAMIPQFNTSRFEMTFSGDESLCRPVKEEEDVRNTAQEEGDRKFIRIGGGPEDEVYTNYATGMTTEMKELGPRKYRIEDSLHRPGWKLEEGERTIRGYVCRKAVAKDRNGSEVVAWYAESISSPAGPDVFGGLPGVILELGVNNSEIVFTAVDIHGNGVTKRDAGKGDAGTGQAGKQLVKAPEGGKKITRAAFQKMMEEQFGAGPGKPMIRIMRQ